jgi:hypothetical protein
MAATQEDINNYITGIRDGFSILAGKAAKKEILGHTDMFCSRQKITIVGDYLEIIEKFFGQADYETNNFFTVDEIKDIMLRVNIICDTNYTINNL